MRRSKESGFTLNGRLRSREGGFTLIELMIVVAIIAALTAVAIVAYTRHLKNSRVVEGHNLIGRVQTMQEAYYGVNGTYCNANGLSPVASIAAGNVHPSFVAGEPMAKVWTTSMPALWGTPGLGFKFDRAKIYWGLVIVAGDQGASYAVGGTSGSGTGNLNLTAGRPWHYVMAWADLDGNGTDWTRMWATSEKRQTVVWDKGK